MRYATARPDDLMQWGVRELELREADRQLRYHADAEKRKHLRAKEIGATLGQANMLCSDAKRFLERKGIMV